MSEFREDTFALCIGRSFGSGGLKFAQALQARLNVPMYDKAILDEASSESNIRREIFERADEKNTFSIPIVYGTSYAVPSSFFVYSDNYLSNENLFTIQSETIQRIAKEESAIFVGRCCDFVLREHPHLLSIFVTENEDVRVKRVMQRLNIESESAARTQMEKIDKGRREYYNFFTSRRWGRADNYDLTLRLSTIGIDYAVDMVVELMKEKGFPIQHK